MTLIKSWGDIQDDFKNGLLFLGNGSSIAIKKAFHYENIREEMKNQGKLSSEINKIFEDLGTVNFERVLEYLYKASIINEILDIDDRKKPKKFHDELRKGLIETVKNMHPEYTNVTQDLKSISTFLTHFRIIIDLNYDLIAYWSLMTDSSIQFNDLFWKEQKLHQMENIRYIVNNEKIILYPHGNLAICKNEKLNYESKIKNKGANILSKLAMEDFSEPIFVAEGISEKKLETIKSSNYLTTVFNILPKLNFRQVTFLGFGFNENDKQILDQLFKNKKIRVSVSLYNEDPGTKENAKKMLAPFIEREIEFFDVKTCGWPQNE